MSKDIRGDTVAVKTAEIRSLPEEWQTRLSPPSWQHACAAQLHGWLSDAHHAVPSDRLRITQTDYEAALAAASTTTGAGSYAPHQPALSPYAPQRSHQ